MYVDGAIAATLLHHRHAVGKRVDVIKGQAKRQHLALFVDKAVFAAATVLDQQRLALDKLAEDGRAGWVEFLHLQVVDVGLFLVGGGGVDKLAAAVDCGVARCQQLLAAQAPGAVQRV